MNIGTFLLAIALVETGNNPYPVGRAGERSEYQITRATWKQHTTTPFNRKNTTNRTTAYCVAERHVNYLLTVIGKYSVLSDADVTACAAMWKCGPAILQRARWSASTLDYSRRVFNTYQALEAAEQSSERP